LLQGAGLRLQGRAKERGVLRGGMLQKGFLALLEQRRADLPAEGMLPQVRMRAFGEAGAVCALLRLRMDRLLGRMRCGALRAAFVLRHGALAQQAGRAALSGGDFRHKKDEMFS